MKKTLLMAGLVLAPIFGVICVNAEDAGEKEVVDWEKVAELKDGVQRVKKDENGKLKSFVAVGSARISRALGVTKGKKMAERRAILKAKAEIVKFLKSSVKSYEMFENEAVTNMVGDGKTKSDTGKSSAKDAARVEEIAEAIVRGTTKLYAGERPGEDDDEYVVILGWSADNAKMAEDAREIMENGGRGAEPSARKKSEDVKDSAPASREIKQDRLQKKSVISPDAANF